MCLHVRALECVTLRCSKTWGQQMRIHGYSRPDPCFRRPCSKALCEVRLALGFW